MTHRTLKFNNHITSIDYAVTDFAVQSRLAGLLISDFFNVFYCILFIYFYLIERVVVGEGSKGYAVPI